MAGTLHQSTGRRASDTDPSQVHNFPRMSEGIRQRLLNSEPGQELRFRPDTPRILVDRSSGLTWGDVLEELTLKGALNPIGSGLRYIRGSEGLESFGNLGLEPTICHWIAWDQEQLEVSKNHRRWPHGLNADFFLSGEKEIDLGLKDIEKICRAIMEVESLSLPEGHPAFDGNIIIESSGANSFGRCIVKLTYKMNDNLGSRAARSRVFLIDSMKDRILFVGRPYLAYKNEGRGVYELSGDGEIFSREPLNAFLGRKFIEAMRKLKRESVSLYRFVSKDHRMHYWEQKNISQMVQEAGHTTNISTGREVKTSWGFSEPRWHFSVEKAPYRTYPSSLVLRKVDIPLEKFRQVVEAGWVDFGIGLGSSGRNRNVRGAMIEVALTADAMLDLEHELNNSLTVV